MNNIKSMLCPDCLNRGHLVEDVTNWMIPATMLGKEDGVTFFICPVCRLIFDEGGTRWEKMS